MNEEMKLDRKRAFGTVYNDPHIGFAQDGKHYRHDGTLYEPPKVESSAKTEAEPAKREVLTRNGVVSK